MLLHDDDDEMGNVAANFAPKEGGNDKGKRNRNAHLLLAD